MPVSGHTPRSPECEAQRPSVMHIEVGWAAVRLLLGAKTALEPTAAGLIPPVAAKPRMRTACSISVAPLTMATRLARQVGRKPNRTMILPANGRPVSRSAPCRWRSPGRGAGTKSSQVSAMPLLRAAGSPLMNTVAPCMIVRGWWAAPGGAAWAHAAADGGGVVHVAAAAHDGHVAAQPAIDATGERSSACMGIVRRARAPSQCGCPSPAPYRLLAMVRWHCAAFGSVAR